MKNLLCHIYRRSELWRQKITHNFFLEKNQLVIGKNGLRMHHLHPFIKNFPGRGPLDPHLQKGDTFFLHPLVALCANLVTPPARVPSGSATGLQFDYPLCCAMEWVLYFCSGYVIVWEDFPRLCERDKDIFIRLGVQVTIRQWTVFIFLISYVWGKFNIWRRICALHCFHAIFFSVGYDWCESDRFCCISVVQI